MKKPFIDATLSNPIILPDGSAYPGTVFLNRVIDHPRMEIGDYTYHNTFEKVDDFARHIAPYLFPNSPEKLIIGKFGQFAHGVKFITASANHPMDGLSTFPFAVFNPETMGMYTEQVSKKGDNIIGNDVWIGHGACIMPGVKIGDGVIISAGAVVTRDIAPYRIVGGNPAEVIRMRFSEDVIETLLKICWWHWEIDKIQQALPAITSGDIKALQSI